MPVQFYSPSRDLNAFVPTIRMQYPTKHIMIVLPNISNKLLCCSVSSTMYKKLKAMTNAKLEERRAQGAMMMLPLTFVF